MSEFDAIKPPLQTTAIRPLNKDSAKKETGKKKKNKKTANKEEADSKGHINEYI